MRFSILIPTRNGGAYLPHVLRSALDQQGDFEVVVSDNANIDETANVLAAHRDDPRLRVSRTERVLPVTENWMRTLDAARGDYMLMIGDDDLLLPGFFSSIESALRRHAGPDVLTFNGYSYVAPGSFSSEASALWSPHHFDMRRLRPERELTKDERLGMVKDMFRFKVRFPLNMQLSLFSRVAVAAVPGDFFRAPFPDHFALNSMLLRAARMVVTDERLIVVGVSPKSFGHYFYGGKQELGVRYLGSEAVFPGMIPGSELVNSMYGWLIELRRAYPELAGMPIARWQYVARQVNHWYRQVEFGVAPPKMLASAALSIRPWEVGTVMLPMVGYRAARYLRNRLRAGVRSYIQDSWPALRPTPNRTIADFARNLPSSDRQDPVDAAGRPQR